MNETATLRLMDEMDLPCADSLRGLIGWNQTVKDWRQLLLLEPEGCFVAVLDGKLVGTVTTITYGLTLGWIGMMLVHPEHRRHGIATRLMVRALEYLQRKPVRTIKLDATPAGRSLYEKLGFRLESELTRWQRPAQTESVALGLRRSETRPLEEQDWLAAGEIDAAAFGVLRFHFLRGLACRSRQVFVWPKEGQVVGWGMLRPGANADYLGPVTCLNSDGSVALVSNLLSYVRGRAVFWDVPEDNEPAKAAAKSFGFVPLRPLSRMRCGAECIPSNPRAQFAIADPAVG